MVKKSRPEDGCQDNNGYQNEKGDLGNSVHPSSLSIVTSSKSHILSAEDGKAPPGPRDIHATSQHPTSYLETLIHLLKGNIGSGLYAMGDAFKNGGLVAGSVLALTLGFICVYSQHMLLHGCREVQRRAKREKLPTFAETVELSFSTGPKQLHRWAKHVKLCINVFLCITQMGFCCVYFVFISDNVKKVMDFYNVELDVHVHMLIVLLPIMLSCWIRDLKYLVPVSLIANLCMTVGIGITLYFLVQDLPPMRDREYVGTLSTLPLFFGTVIYSFEGIGLVLPLQNEMKNPDKFIGRFGVLNVGMVVVTTLLVSIGFLGYLKYGSDVQGSLTLNLEQADPLAQAVQLILSVGILFSYALQIYVPIAILWPRIQNKWGPFRWDTFAEIAFRSTLVIITFAMAEAIPHLELFISLVGAVSSSALALLFPSMMDLAVHWESGQGRTWLIIKNGFIMLLGVIGFLTGTYCSIREIVNKF